MNQSRFFPVASVVLALTALVTTAHGAILQSFAGPFTTTNTQTTIVDTTTDSGDWINAYSSGASTVPIYMQFTISVTNNTGETGSGGFFAGFQLFSGGTGGANERLAVGNYWESVNWSYFNGDGSANLAGTAGSGAANPITPTETATFVLKFTQSAATATVWMDPNLSLSEGAQDTGLTSLLTPSTTNLTFDRILVRAGNTTGSATFSDIVIRTDSPFVPEPGITTMVAIFGCTLLLRRRTLR